MSDDVRYQWLLHALRGHLRVLQATHQLTVLECVRLATALVRTLQDECRDDGADEAAIRAQLLQGDPQYAAAPGHSSAPAATVAAMPPLTLAAEPMAPPAPELPAEAASGRTLLFAAPVLARPTVTMDPALVAVPLDRSPEPDPFALFESPPPAGDDGELLDAVIIGQELAPEPDAGVQAGQLADAARRHPRLVTRTEVLVAVEGRAETATLLTRDISAGGMFVSTEQPPPAGTIVRITLRTLAGDLELRGRVVSALDGAQALTSGDEPGAGIQFTQLGESQRLALEHYVGGLAQQRKEEAAADVAATDDVLLRCARNFMANVDISEFYAAIEIDPAADADQVQARVDELGARFMAAAATGRPEQDALLLNAARILAHVAQTLTVPSRRLAYDFAHGHVRAEQRIATCAATGDSPDSLRAMWHQIFPDHLAQAQALLAEAVARSRAHDYVGAQTLGSQALERDPFNQKLAAAIAHWRQRQ